MHTTQSTTAKNKSDILKSNFIKVSTPKHTVHAPSIGKKTVRVKLSFNPLTLISRLTFKNPVKAINTYPVLYCPILNNLPLK